MNLKKILSISTLLSFIPFSAYSNPVQIETTDNLTFFGFGTTTINTDNLNKNLNPLGYPNLPTNMLFLGGGNRTISGKIVTGVESFFAFENNVTNPQNNHRAFNSSSFNMIGDIGYMVYSGNGFRVYPMVGAGIGRIFVDIFKNEKSPEFQNLAKDPDKGIALASTNIVGDLALGGDYVIGLGKSNPKKGGLVICFRAGYLFTMYSTGLQFKGEPVKNAPDINNNGFYIRLNLGYTNGIIPSLIDIF